MRHGLWIRAALSAFIASASSAHAHVTLEQPQAAAGAYYKAVLRVGHGCDGSPVTELIATIPPGVQGAKPLAKPGWQIEITRSPLATPITSHGRTVTDDVSRIRWHGGRIDPAHFEEFVLLAKLPDAPGPLYWKVTQVCEAGRIDWAQVPAAGQSLHDLKAPAAVLEVVPAAPAAAHVH